MDEIKVLKIIGSGGACRFCGKDATRIVGNDYDICSSADCLDWAIEKKEDDMNYLVARLNQVRAQYGYELRLNK